MGLTIQAINLTIGFQSSRGNTCMSIYHNYAIESGDEELQKRRKIRTAEGNTLT